MEKTLSLPAKTKKVINNYFELPLGRKKIKCPYFMNLKKERAGLRVMIGKGSAEEIAHEVKVWAQLKGINLNKLSENEIRAFMIKKGIGIDCSGFAVYVLDSWFRELKIGHIWSKIKYRNNSLISKFRRTLRPVENISADLLTSEINCNKIVDFNQIKPGDLIRAKGKQKNSHHAAIITSIVLDMKNNIKEFEYVHSHRFYDEENGVRRGKVIITNVNKELKDQKWEDHFKGRNYMLEDLLIDYKDNGIRRLKVI